MRLVTFEIEGVPRLGALLGERVVDLAAAAELSGSSAIPSDINAFLDDAGANLEKARTLLERGDPRGSYPLDRVRLMAPIPRPKQNVLAVGRNYYEHVSEATAVLGKQVDVPEHPMFFTKRASSIIGPEAPIHLDPAVTTQLDWEAELAVVLGRRGKNIRADQAYEYVFGYTCTNDISAREVQLKRHAGQYFRGKSLDDFCPLGPWIVTRDELPDISNLRLTCRVNGVVKQDSTTARMIFDVPRLLEELSAGMTLDAGDVLSTGTPSGVGIARNPQEFLKPGDVVEVEIEGIGILRNRIVTAERT